MRFPHEGLTPSSGQPVYDTSYVSHRQVAKDFLFSYRGNCCGNVPDSPPSMPGVATEPTKM